MADVTLAVSAVEQTPLDYPVPGAAELLIKMLTASYNGSGAAGNFVPAVQLIIGGTIVAGTFPLGSTVTAGASVDVSWFPWVGGGGGSSSGGGARLAMVRLDSPDATGNGYPALSLNNGFVTIRRIVPAFQRTLDGTWIGSIEVPSDYASGATIVLVWEANATTGNLRHNVATSVVAAGSMDAALTAEAFMNTAVPATALHRFSTSFVLSTTPAAGDTLLVQVERNGSNAADTLAVDALLWGCALKYVSSY